MDTVKKIFIIKAKEDCFISSADIINFGEKIFGYFDYDINHFGYVFEGKAKYNQKYGLYKDKNIEMFNDNNFASFINTSFISKNNKESPPYNVRCYVHIFRNYYNEFSINCVVLNNKSTIINDVEHLKTMLESGNLLYIVSDFMESQKQPEMFSDGIIGPKQNECEMKIAHSILTCAYKNTFKIPFLFRYVSINKNIVKDLAKKSIKESNNISFDNYYMNVDFSDELPEGTNEYQCNDKWRQCYELLTQNGVCEKPIL